MSKEILWEKQNSYVTIELTFDVQIFHIFISFGTNVTFCQEMSQFQLHTVVNSILIENLTRNITFVFVFKTMLHYSSVLLQ